MATRIEVTVNITIEHPATVLPTTTDQWDHTVGKQIEKMAQGLKSDFGPGFRVTVSR